VRDGDGLAATGHGIGRIVGALFAFVAFLWIASSGVAAVAVRGRCCLIFVRLDVHKSRGLGFGFDGLHIRIRLSFNLRVSVFFVVFVGGRRGGRIDVRERVLVRGLSRI
jgi:hypothetical protein